MEPNFPDQLTLSVTETDIISGVRTDPCDCPIAKCFKRQWPHYDTEGFHPIVMSGYFQIARQSDSEIMALYEMPESATKWMQDYDDCMVDTKPITFSAERTT